MRAINNETRLTMNKRRNFVNYATMTLHDGTVLNLTPSDFRISGNNFTDDWCDSDAFQLGSAIGKTATILLDNTDGRREEIDGEVVTYLHGKFSEYDFYMAYFTLYVCLPEAYHYEGELKDEMIRIGKFTVVDPVANSSTIEITGVDNMYMFDKPFDDCQLDFENGVSLGLILRTCCDDCGVAIGWSSFNNQELVVHKKPEGVTYRQMVSYIAQIAGCNAKISETGALILSWYNMAPFIQNWLDGGTFSTDTTPYSDGDTADGGSFNPWNVGSVFDGGEFTTPLDYHNLTATTGTSVSTDDIQFTGVLVSYEDVSVHYPETEGWDTYVLEVTDNPLVEGYESSIALFLFSQLSNLKFRPFNCSSIQDPTIEAGDCAVVYDVKGNMYQTIITNVEFTTGSYTELSCKAQSPIKQNSRYVNPAAQAVAQSEKRMDDYNAQVAHFNELASEALGYYTTTEVDPETGATITYIHNAATLENSRIIWKITSDGIFISEDYGQSYNSGYDTSTGTMLMNLIYAHGITCDWIQSGTLTLGGFDNENGVCSVRNAGNTEVVRLDVNGITANAGTFNGNVTISSNGSLGTFGTASSMNGFLAKNGSLGISADRGSSWCGMAFGTEAAEKTGWSNAICALWNGGDGGGGFHVINGTPIRTDPQTFTALKYNVLQFWRTLVLRGWLDEGGWQTSSDRNKKKNIKELSITKIRKFFSKVKPSSFQYRDDENDWTHYGIIAQELTESFEEAGLSSDAVIRETEEAGSFVNYVELHGLELGGIKDLYDIVNKQQEEINALKQRIEQLETIVNTNK